VANVMVGYMGVLIANGGVGAAAGGSAAAGANITIAHYLTGRGWRRRGRE